MIPIRIDGEYNTAKVFTHPDSIEDYATAQIKMICDQPVVESYKDIVVMPDVHPGKIGPIGLVMHGRSESPILPGLIGPDIGCGITMFPIKGDIDFQKLDRVINAYIPSGTAIRKKPSRFVSSANAYNWIGTLGGGNHFIEIDKDDIVDLITKFKPEYASMLNMITINGMSGTITVDASCALGYDVTYNPGTISVPEDLAKTEETDLMTIFAAIFGGIDSSEAAVTPANSTAE